ncbi:transcription-repair coupling factor [Fuchsiella alkaliacetigena]|nr:transcription-repair coupling factor [Fuchsiella alkaliacetigena]
MINALTKLLTEFEAFKNLKQAMDLKLNTKLTLNLSVSQRAFIIANLYAELEDRAMLLTYNRQRAIDIYEELLRIIPAAKLFLFPELEVLPHERIEEDISVRIERLEVLTALNSTAKPLVILPIKGLLQRLVPQPVFVEHCFEIKQSNHLHLQKLKSDLVAAGYKRVDMVTNKGEFSVRGGIIDIYSLTMDSPVRIELFGEEIDSIRTFDLDTQRSIKKIEQVLISPATETLLNFKNLNNLVPKIEKKLLARKKSLISASKEAEAQELLARYNEDLEKIKAEVVFPGIEQYLPFIYQDMATVIDYFGSGSLIFDSPNRVCEQAFNLINDFNELRISLLNQGTVLKNYDQHFADFEKLLLKINNFPQLYLSETQKIKKFKIDREISLKINKTTKFRSQINQFIKELKEWKEQKFRILITLSTASKCKTLVERLQEEGLAAIYVAEVKDQLKVGNIVVTVDSLAEGLIIPEVNFILFTEGDIFADPQRKNKRKSKTYDQGIKIASLEELEIGDYVVHENHGIGKYLGVKTLEVQGHNKDYLLINYADQDKLYVPTDQVDLIQKYVGSEGAQPKLYSLDSSEWSRVKKRVKESVQEMAEDLLELYAQREVANGYAFAEDTVWQQEFEDEFPYQETPDQLKAIQEVKEDMESPQPMDRLLCGDVGYGKTEVAIRAAFKAVMDGKQVAMLVPTTILAQQHLNTFTERFISYPIKIDVLSRFKTAKEQQQLIKDLKLGSLDIIIGTHRLLSADVQFKDLGLLIVDEEQRFGVKHKEKLKELKSNIDVLTLTATPIPRTLHMSLVGVRDMSLIETPPENRYPIRTYVREYNPGLIRNAITRELNRGGQVYFVHNRVADIDKVAARIQKLLPEAEVAVAHGQMSESKLERIMMSFLEEKHNVLVCTTIIETGLDIPNVNTIVINKADQMGLAQLYQLRGRVGRSNRVAYAYLLYQQGRVLSEVAEKRLQAIKEFTNLGSGFKIAMRDLEIRGAGNILGPKQHGHIEAVGFSLYCKLLDQAITDLKDQPELESEPEMAVVDVEVDAYISDDYISDSKQKIEIYKKISKVTSLNDIAEIEREMEDRFGVMPKPFLNLIKLARIRVLATKLNVDKVFSKEGEIAVKFSSATNLTGEKILELSKQYQLRFRSAKEPLLALQVIQNKSVALDKLTKILKQLQE